ncbi:MAG TPA: hypothetical protein VH538_09390 [Gaiellaceae bacterium]|jgi:hypothetical protein
MNDDDVKVLVVLLEGGDRAELRRAVGVRDDDQHVRVVAPPSVGTLQWLTNDEDDARAEASDRARGAARTLAAQEHRVEARRGDVDPVQAVEDALREFPADEIVIVGRPDDGALELSLAEFGLPVRRAEGVPAPEPGDAARRETQRVVQGRSETSPFAFIARVNLVVLVVVALVVVLAFLAIWLF